MNQEYEVIWSNRASKDSEHIIKYIANDSPFNALQILKKIRKKRNQTLAEETTERASHLKKYMNNDKKTEYLRYDARAQSLLATEAGLADLLTVPYKPCEL